MLAIRREFGFTIQLFEVAGVVDKDGRLTGQYVVVKAEGKLFLLVFNCFGSFACLWRVESSPPLLFLIMLLHVEEEKEEVVVVVEIAATANSIVSNVPICFPFDLARYRLPFGVAVIPIGRILLFGEEYNIVVEE